MGGSAVGGGDLPQLFVGIHAAEKAHGVGHVCGGLSRCDSADDRLGGWDGTPGSRCLATVLDFVFLAISALSRHFLDVPGRLRTGGNTDVAGSRSRRYADVSPDHYHRWHAGRSERAAIRAW